MEPAIVEPLFGEVSDTTGGVTSFNTVTMTGAAVAVLPAASRVRAPRVWLPLATPMVFQGIVYGPTVSSAPSVAPSSRSCTPTTPTLSDALAETTADPETVAPVSGAVSETVGASASLKT